MALGPYREAAFVPAETVEQIVVAEIDDEIPPHVVRVGDEVVTGYSRMPASHRIAAMGAAIVVGMMLGMVAFAQ